VALLDASTPEHVRAWLADQLDEALDEALDDPAHALSAGAAGQDPQDAARLLAAEQVSDARRARIAHLLAERRQP
jgi:hypothetical protein